MVVSSNEPVIGFRCEPLDGQHGWTWTLTTRLSNLLEEAERRFGPRDLQWTPVGIEFGGGNPGVWYPGGWDRKHISIRLSRHAADRPERAIFQLTHEVIHLLSPGPREEALAIEEGLATLFSLEVSCRFKVNLVYGEAAYNHAAAATKKLLDIDPDAVKRLRAKRPSFSEFTPDFVRENIPEVSEQLACDLCERWDALEVRLG